MYGDVVIALDTEMEKHMELIDSKLPKVSCFFVFVLFFILSFSTTNVFFLYRVSRAKLAETQFSRQRGLMLGNSKSWTKLVLWCEAADMALLTRQLTYIMEKHLDTHILYTLISQKRGVLSFVAMLCVDIGIGPRKLHHFFQNTNPWSMKWNRFLEECTLKYTYGTAR